MNSSSMVAGAGSLPVPNRVLDRIHLHEIRVGATDDSVSFEAHSFVFFWMQLLRCRRGTESPDSSCNSFAMLAKRKTCVLTLYAMLAW